MKALEKESIIKALKWDAYSLTVSWKWRGEKIEKTYEHPPFKALLLKDRQTVVIIASTKDEGVENAGIYNPDGSLGYKLKVPSIKPKFHGFYDVYYSNDEVKLILLTGSKDYPYDTGCTFDPETGEMTNFHNVK